MTNSILACVVCAIIFGGALSAALKAYWNRNYAWFGLDVLLAILAESALVWNVQQILGMLK